MKNFTYTDLWKALAASIADPSGTATVPDVAPGEFVAELQSYCREESDLAERTRTLKIAVSELAAIGRCLPYESGKKRAYPIGDRPCCRRHRMRTDDY